MNKEKCIVAIDLGTTGNRSIAFSHKGDILAQAYRKLTQHYPQPGWVEHAPEELYRTALECLKEVSDNVGAENINAIGITNQRETSIIWNRKTGKPIYNAIVWQDRRTSEHCKKLSSKKKIVKKKTGLFIDPYFSASKINWLLDKFDPAREKSQKGELLFGTPETWVLWNLTKGKSHFTEPSNASRTMLFNINKLHWDKALLKIFNVSEEILPEVKDSDSLFGYTDKALLGKEIPIQGILGDQQASLFGQLGWDSRTVKSTYGTGIFILRNTENRSVYSDKLVSTIAWKINGKTQYALEGSLFMGGACLQWLQENINILESPEESGKAAMELNDNEGVYFIPAFQGLGAPFWDPDARALMIGLSRKSSRNTIIRAALESMAYQVRDIIEAFNEVLKEDVKTLKVDGGASKNEFLMQFQSELLNLPVIKTRITEKTALGAAGIAGISSGFWTEKTFSEISKIEKTYNAKGSYNIYNKYYSEWNKAVKRSLKWI